MNPELRALLDELHGATSGDRGYSYQHIETLCRCFIAARVRQSAQTLESLPPVKLDENESEVMP
jgi:hypothetical protein